MNTTRWWENYLVRYLVPSIVGMIILIWLSRHFPALTNHLPILPLDKSSKFNTAHLIGWLLFGTVYCYLASYPILVFHAIRVRFYKNKQTNTVNRRTVLPIILFTLLALPSAYLASVHRECAFILILISLTLFSGYQISQIYQLSDENQKRNGYDYAVRLTKMRKGQDNFVESYKHLREHGNTALIIWLEILLAAVLYVALGFEKHYEFIHFSVTAIILLIWIAPAALIYFYGHYLERRLSDFESE